MRIGCHVSVAKSYDLAFDRAEEKGCRTFQIFTKNPRGWAFKNLEKEEIQRFRNKKTYFDMNPLVAHISYLPNLASLNDEIYKKSIDSFLKEINRCVDLDISYFVIHSGSYRGGTYNQGLNIYVNSILKGIEEGKGKVTILIENSAGGEKSLTGTLANIQQILDEINDKKLVQVCFDTCHAFTAGYDLSKINGVKSFSEEVHSTIGMSAISVVHGNDSKTGVGSQRDLHEHIGLGMIGEEGFRALINEPDLRKKPWILETPIDSTRGDSDNINYLKSLIEK